MTDQPELELEPASAVVYNSQGYIGHGDNAEEAKTFFRRQGGQLRAGYTILYLPEGCIFQGFDENYTKFFWDGPEPTVELVPPTNEWMSDS